MYGVDPLFVDGSNVVLIGVRERRYGDNPVVIVVVVAVVFVTGNTYGVDPISVASVVVVLVVVVVVVVGSKVAVFVVASI